MVRVGINMPTTVVDRDGIVARAELAESLGFDFISASDHPAVSTPNYETWTMLTWLAACTTRIRIATRVLGLPYRSPAMVAKMAETLARLSSGRLILGLGGGHSDDEFKAFGLGVPTPREKVQGLRDGLHIIRGLWTQTSFSYDGQRYQVFDADLEPKPADPIPIWLGTYGPRALDVTGELADGWIPSLGYATRDDLFLMRSKVRGAADRAGRNPDDIACVLNVPVRVDDDAHDSDSHLAGTPDRVARTLADFVHHGFDGFNIMPIGDDYLSQVRLLGEEVLPLLHRATE